MHVVDVKPYMEVPVSVDALDLPGLELVDDSGGVSRYLGGGVGVTVHDGCTFVHGGGAPGLAQSLADRYGVKSRLVVP